MPYAPIASGQIYYETDGDPGALPLLLVEGGFTQLIGWAPDFVEQLTDAGFFVIRADNRDTGLSTHFGGPEDLDGGYELKDMADDMIAVLDDAGVDSVHCAGRSMGGMISQVMAIEYPQRVRSLGLFYSIPGQDPRYILHGPREELNVPQSRFSAAELLERALAAHRAFMPHGDLWGEQQWYEDETRRYIADSYARRYSPDGAPRQWNALKRAPERLAELRSVTVPAAVVHGREDHVLHWCAALDIAEAMPTAELHVYPGMGHFFPPALIPDFVQILRRTAQLAELTIPPGRWPQAPHDR